MGIVFIVVILFVVAIIVYLYQSQSLHGPFVNFLIAFFILALVVSLVVAYVSSSANLTSFEGLTKFIKYYFTWLRSIFTNTGNIVGYAVQQNWINSSNITGG